MSNNPRGYNGLHLPGGAQSLASQQEQLKIAFATQVQAIAREIYVRVTANLLSGVDMEADCAFPTDDEFRDLSHNCQRAAMAYFEGAGLVRSKSPG